VRGGRLCERSVIKAWKDSGIRDSKNISSDKKIGELAELIRKTPGCVTTVVRLATRLTTGFTPK
jgi:ribonuclease HIII